MDGHLNKDKVGPRPPLNTVKNKIQMDKNIETWERNIDWLLPTCTRTRIKGQLGMCPDWESKLQPFGYRMMCQPTEPHQPGLFLPFWFTNVDILLWWLWRCSSHVFCCRNCNLLQGKEATGYHDACHVGTTLSACFLSVWHVTCMLHIVQVK